jgi:hypothetical protein
MLVIRLVLGCQATRADFVGMTVESAWNGF